MIEKIFVKVFWKGFVLIEGNLKVYLFYWFYFVLIIIRFRIFWWFFFVVCDNFLGMEVYEIWDGDVIVNSYKSFYELYWVWFNGVSGW